MQGLIKTLNARADEGINVAALYKTIEDAQLQKRRTGTTKKVSFSPSSIGYQHGSCPRYWFYMFEGVTYGEEYVDDTSAQSLATMENGTYTHDRLQSLLKTAGIVVDLEREINLTDPPIRGFVDAILEIEGDEVIGEIKSAKQEVFQIRKTQNKPSLNHMLQLLLYMYVLERRYGVFIYENKNTQELLIIPVIMNDRRKREIEKLIEWMRTVRKTWEDKKLPVRPYTKKSRVCKKCQLFEHCWSGPQGDIAVEEMPVSELL